MLPSNFKVGEADICGLKVSPYVQVPKHIYKSGKFDLSKFTGPLIHRCAYCALSTGDAEGKGQPLLKCSRCGVTLYCDQLCQLGDLDDHKKQCKAVAKTKKGLEEKKAEVEKSAEGMQNTYDRIANDPAVKDFINAFFKLAIAKFDLGVDNKILLAIEEAVKDFSEIFRLGCADRIVYLLFGLLALERTQDTFDLALFLRRPDWRAAHKQLTQDSKSGDYIVPASGKPLRHTPYDAHIDYKTWTADWGENSTVVLHSLVLMQLLTVRESKIMCTQRTVELGLDEDDSHLDSLEKKVLGCQRNAAQFLVVLDTGKAKGYFEVLRIHSHETMEDWKRKFAFKQLEGLDDDLDVGRKVFKMKDAFEDLYEIVPGLRELSGKP